MDIKVGDMVFWYENGHTSKKIGQVIQIVGNLAIVYCDKDKKTYEVENPTKV